MIQSIISRMGVMFIGNVISKGISFLFFYFLAKSMGVDDYGRITIILIGITSVVELASAGINANIIRSSAKNSTNAEHLSKLITTSILNSAIIFAVATPIFYYNLNYLGDFLFDTYKYNDAIAISIIPTFLAVIYGQLSSFFIGLEKFKEYAIISICFQFFRLGACYLIFQIHESTVDSMILGIALANFISVLFSLFICFTRTIVNIRIARYSIDLFRSNFSFGFWMGIWAIITIVQNKIDLYYINYHLSLSDVANYDIALKFIMLVMIVFNSYSATLTPIFSRIESVSSLKIEVKKTVPHLLLFSCLTVFCAFSFPFIIELFYGAQYEIASDIIVPMMASLVLFLFTLPFNAVIYSLGYSKLFCVTAVVELMAKVLMLPWLMETFGVYGAAYVYVLINLLSLILSFLFYKYVSLNKEEHYV